jgi:Zn-dependent peptidase ImmA (M78 family)
MIDFFLMRSGKILFKENKRSVMEMSEVPIVLKDLPVGIRGFICLGSDYEPVIVINSRLSREQQQKTYDHEREHLRRGEMFNEDYHEYEGG